MFIKTLIYILFIRNIESTPPYPTRRWLKICNSSNIYNKTIKLRDYLKDNLDVLYL